MDKTVEIEYFAILREKVGHNQETWTTQAEKAEDLYRELQQHHQLSFPMENLRVAINEEFSNWDDAIQHGDKIVFIPPVAGG